MPCSASIRLQSGCLVTGRTRTVTQPACGPSRRRGLHCHAHGRPGRPAPAAPRRGGRSILHLRAARQQLRERAFAHEPAAVDDAHDVRQLLDLGQDVAGHEHGLAALGEVAQQSRAWPRCRPGRGRWPARRAAAGPGRTAGRPRCPAAGACRGSRSGPCPTGAVGEADGLEDLVHPCDGWSVPRSREARAGCRARTGTDRTRASRSSRRSGTAVAGRATSTAGRAPRCRPRWAG